MPWRKIMMCYSLFRNNPKFISVSAGKPLFSEGEPSKLMYVLITGEARVTVGGRELEWLRPGDTVGEMSLIGREPQTTTVEAVSDCEFVCVDEDRFEFLASDAPGFALELMRLVAHRLRTAERPLLGQPLAVPANNVQFVTPLETPSTVEPQPNHPH
jgi:CRP/FNR family cyclic AMP-dependent transcriptional regulator